MKKNIHVILTLLLLLGTTVNFYEYKNFNLELDKLKIDAKTSTTLNPSFIICQIRETDVQRVDTAKTISVDNLASNDGDFIPPYNLTLGEYKISWQMISDGVCGILLRGDSTELKRYWASDIFKKVTAFVDSTAKAKAENSPNTVTADSTIINNR